MSGVVIWLVKILLRLRYLIRINKPDILKDGSGKGMLFLPNHPALIDPVIVITTLYKKYKIRPLIAEDQLDISIIKKITNKMRPISIPDLSITGKSRKADVGKAINEVVSTLKSGDNVLLYPAGRIYRSNREYIGGKSAVYQVLKAIPDLKLVLIRTSGLWGSSFSRASGRIPELSRHIVKYILFFIFNFVFFGPRRKVNLEICSDYKLPDKKGKTGINKCLEAFYNKIPEENVYVPYFWFQGLRSRILPEGRKNIINYNLNSISDDLKDQVMNYLCELTGRENINIEDELAKDLGVDSLSLLEITSYLQHEFGIVIEDINSLECAGDCILAAAGKNISKRDQELKQIPSQWFKDIYKGARRLPSGKKITDIFLNQAKQKPGAVLIADQISGVKQNRDIIMGIYALQPFLKNIPAKNIGLMFPATVTAVIAYFSLLFSGKTPVMVNWTTGNALLEYSLKSVDVIHVITAKAVVEKLKDQGFDYTAIKVKWIFLDDIAKKINLFKKLAALFKSYSGWGFLYKAEVSDTAAILFTSGSEANPKAVPLNHKNILTNIKDMSTVLNLDHRLLGMLPPFHSFGLVVTTILPLCLGMQTVYHSNPTESVILSKLVAAYGVSLLLGTPTFINGIVRVASAEQLNKLKLIITGAEKCPDYLYKDLSKICPQAVICEGYGITECSPVISLNSTQDARSGTIGKVLPSLEYRIIDPDSLETVKSKEQGILLVRGDSVFSGYLTKNVKSPFINFEGKLWYNTGDLVKADKTGHLTFCGRLKRFIKLGGEMVSLPAIEAALLKYYINENEDGPVLAVEATLSEENPEIVLFTTIDINRENANAKIREQGLSGLHNIRKVKNLDKIPVLGTGKIDYKKLKTMLLS